VRHCDVRDNQGNYCPDEAEHYFDYKGKKVGLCKLCYLNFINGAYR